MLLILIASIPLLANGIWRNFLLLSAVEDYARRWIKREVDQDPGLESLSDWVRTIRSLVQGRIHKLKHCVNSRPMSVFKDQEAVKCLSSLHDKYVIVPADKASNNIVFVCKSYYLLLMLIASIPLLANGIWRNFLLLS
jgi:hypothetical protein